MKKQSKLDAILAQVKGNQKTRRIAAVLACLVVLGTLWRLTLPAITLEWGKPQAEGITEPEMEETLQEEELLAEESLSEEEEEAPLSWPTLEEAAAAGYPDAVRVDRLICGQRESEGHTHTADCIESYYTAQTASFAEEAFLAMPAQRFEGEAGNLSVRIDAAEGTFPETTEMALEEVDTEEVRRAASGLVNGKISQVLAVDIGFLYEGEKIEPEQPVQVVLSGSALEGMENPVVLHIDGEGNAEIVSHRMAEEPAPAPRMMRAAPMARTGAAELTEETIEENNESTEENTESVPEGTEAADEAVGEAADDIPKGALVFEAEEFSAYAVLNVLETTYITADGETYVITVAYDDEAGIPEGAALEVREILPETEEYAGYLAASAEKLGVENGEVSFARFFDIEIVKDGEKVEPKTPVQVTIAYADALQIGEGNVLSVVHFAEKETELIADITLTEDGKGITYQQESFSVTGTIITGPAEVGEKYAIVIKGDNNTYYIVQNDGSLEEVSYSPEKNEVSMDYPMLWTYSTETVDSDVTGWYSGPVQNLRIPTEACGFDDFALPSGYYYRYISPDSDAGFFEEPKQGDAKDPETKVKADQAHPGYVWQCAIRYENHHLQGISKYLGIDTEKMTVKGNMSVENAAEVYLAKVTSVPPSSNMNHTVNHIDISIEGGTSLSVPLAYGEYYYYVNGVKKTLIVSPENNVTLELVKEEVDITPNNMKQAELTAYSKQHGILNNAYFVSGYSQNKESGESTSQVRIEGSFKVSDLDPYTNTDEDHLTDNQLQDRLDNRIYYTVTVVKNVDFPWEYEYAEGEKAQLYDKDGQPLSTSVMANLSKSFDYWDESNECPPVTWERETWRKGHIIWNSSDANGTGMDFTLEAKIIGDSSTLAVEIDKELLTETGETLQPRTPVKNQFIVYQKTPATSADINGVTSVGVGEDDPQINTDGYSGMHAKSVTVDSTGKGMVYDYDVKAGMAYIEEDQNSIPETITDKDGNVWQYVSTRTETEYVWRKDGDEGKVHSVNGLKSVPEVLGKYGPEDEDLFNGFLEFKVYNIYKQPDSETVTLPVIKRWDDFGSSEYSWTARFQLQYMERKISGDGEDDAVAEWTNYDPEQILEINKGYVNQWEVSSTFGELPKYVERNGNRYECQYSAEEMAFTVWKNNEMLYSFDGTDYTFGDGADDTIYKAFYDHDANEDWDGNWRLEISNSASKKIEPREIDISLKKAWEPEIPENASAKFVLKRYVQTEYVDYNGKMENPTITVQLQDTEGNVLSSLQTKSGMNVYLSAAFAADKTGTLSFTKGSETYTLTNSVANGQKKNVRSQAIPVSGREGDVITITMTDGDASTLLADGTSGLQVTDRLEGTNPAPDDFSREVIFPRPGMTGEDAWRFSFDDLLAEDGEWNAAGNQANFNIYSYYLEEIEATLDDANVVIRDSKGNIISADNRLYADSDVTATNRKLGDHIHLEKRWFRLVADQMPPVVIKVTQTINNVTSDVTQDAYDAYGNVVKYSTKYGGYILDKNNGWAIDLDELTGNVKRQFQETGFINGGDPADGYLSGTLMPVPTGDSGYDSKHYYFSSEGIAPNENEHDELVGQITTNGGDNIYATNGTMFVYNVPNYIGYQVEVHKKWFSFNGSTGLADITDHYGTAEGNGFIMQLQQRARWKGTATVASDWSDYGEPFEIYINHNTAGINGFEQVMQGTWLTTVDEKNLSHYGYLYNTTHNDYELVEYEYRFVEVGVIEGNDGRLWSKSTASVNDPASEGDHRYRLENFEVGKLELQKHWELKSEPKASEVYFKIYSDWWFSSYGAHAVDGKYDVAEIIGNDINTPTLSTEEKARIQAYWLANGITVKRVGDLGYVFAVTGQDNDWSGLVRGLPLLKADPNDAGDPGHNSYGEVLYSVAEVGAWYKGGLVKTGDSSWPYVEPLYYRNTRNQGLNQVENGETFQIDNGTVDYQSYFRTVNSDTPSMKFHADKQWENNKVPSSGSKVKLTLQALVLTPSVLENLTATEEQSEGIRIDNLTEEQIQQLIELEGWEAADIENATVTLPKSWDYASMEAGQAKDEAARKAWSVEWLGLKTTRTIDETEYEILYRVVETDGPNWTTPTYSPLTLEENYALSQTVTNEPNEADGELRIKKVWNDSEDTTQWPEGYVINYTLVQHAYLAAVSESDGELTYSADRTNPLFEAEYTTYTSTYGEAQPAENGKITKTQNPVTLHGLPKGDIWTAPAELTDEMTDAGITAGQVYAIAYGYEVVETGVTVGEQSLPFTAASEVLEVNTSETAEGILNNETTEVKVEKIWDNYNPEDSDTVTVTLYSSTVAPDPQADKVNVTAAMSWKNGTVAPEEGFSISVTIVGTDSKGDTIGTWPVTLDQNNPSVTTQLEKYDDYDEFITYTVSLSEGSTGVEDAAITGSNTVSGQDGTVTITATGDVPKNTGSITIQNVDFNGTITIAEVNGGGKQLSDWSSTSIATGSTVTLSELTPGVEYFVKLSGFQQNGTDPVPSFPSNVRHENWGGDQGYWITATESDTKIMLTALPKVQVTIHVVAHGEYAAGGSKSGWKFSDLTPNYNNDLGFNSNELSVTNAAVTTTTGWNYNTPVSWQQIKFEGIENLADVKWRSTLPSFTANAGQHWGSTDGFFTVSANSGSSATATITITLGSEGATADGLMGSRLLAKPMKVADTLTAAATKTYTGPVTTTTVTLPTGASGGQGAQIVGRSGKPADADEVGSVELSNAADETTGEAWSHLWTNLPKTDADGNTLYYYIEETSATISGTKVRTSYERIDATENEPETIKITNKVEDDRKFGSLKVTKELTGVTTEKWWSKAFKFTLKNSDGKYLNAATKEWQDGNADAEFTVSPETAVQFDNLPLDTYVVTETNTETELTIEAYDYDAAGSITGSSGITVSESNTTSAPAVFELKNNYIQKTTDVSVTKVWVNKDKTNTAPEDATVTFELYQSGTEEAVASITLDGEIDENGEAEEWVASWIGLPAYDADENPYTYTVKEKVDDNGFAWEHYVVSYGTDETTQAPLDSAVDGGTITNTDEDVEIKILKVDANKRQEYLSGAVFKVYKKNASSVYEVFTDSQLTEGQFTISDKDNGMKLSLPAGEYKIEEVSPPSGYVKTDGSTFYFTVSGETVTYTDDKGTQITDDSSMLVRYTSDNKTFTVGNEPGAALPSTGGPGTRAITLAGLALTLLALVGIVQKRKG